MSSWWMVPIAVVTFGLCLLIFVAAKKMLESIDWEDDFDEDDEFDGRM